jgi:hypothetical protein
MIAVGVAMIVGGVAVPAAAAGLIGGGIAVILSGLLLVYLDAPSKKPKPPIGAQKAKATVLDAALTPGSVNGYQLVEVTLEVKPKGSGVPYQVKHKFSAQRLGGRFEAGRTFDVYVDPANPKKIDLA